VRSYPAKFKLRLSTKLFLANILTSLAFLLIAGFIVYSFISVRTKSADVANTDIENGTVAKTKKSPVIRAARRCVIVVAGLEWVTSIAPRIAHYRARWANRVEACSPGARSARRPRSGLRGADQDVRRVPLHRRSRPGLKRVKHHGNRRPASATIDQHMGGL